MNSKTSARVTVTLGALSLCFVCGSVRALIARRRGGPKQVHIIHGPSRTAALHFVTHPAFYSEYVGNVAESARPTPRSAFKPYLKTPGERTKQNGPVFCC